MLLSDFFSILDLSNFLRCLSAYVRYICKNCKASEKFISRMKKSLPSFLLLIFLSSSCFLSYPFLPFLRLLSTYYLSRSLLSRLFLFLSFSFSHSTYFLSPSVYLSPSFLFLSFYPLCFLSFFLSFSFLSPFFLSFLFSFFLSFLLFLSFRSFPIYFEGQSVSAAIRASDTWQEEYRQPDRETDSQPAKAGRTYEH